MEKDNSPKHKVRFRLIAAISTLLGILIGSPLAWSVIENNDGGEFWYREGNPEIGPIVYNYGMVLFGYLVWTIPFAIIAFVILATSIWIINAFRL